MSIMWTNNQNNTLSNLAVTPRKGLQSAKGHHLPKICLDLLQPVRQWLDLIEIHDPKVARFLYKIIPAQCPFERDLKLFGRKVVHIPPLCKLNPLYDQLVGLRFRSLCYLVNQCSEDI